MTGTRFSSCIFTILIFIGGVKASENLAGKLPSPLYSPFSFHIDPMERLLLVNIEEDPDSLYLGFEPQVFNDTVNGKGILVIAWRTDGYVDVYHQQGLQLNPEKYDIAGKGLAHLIEREFDGAYFYLNPQGAQAWLQWEDIAERNIVLQVEENNSRTRKPFGLLAPMGHAAENPSALPLVLLHDFYFVRQKHSLITVHIDGEVHQPDKLSLPIDRQRMYFARYCPDPLIATLNPAMHDVLTPLKQQGELLASANNNYYKLAKIQEEYHIESMYTKSGDHKLRMNFEPAFPNIAHWNDTVPLKGQFNITGDRSTGTIGGDYSLEYKDGEIFVRMSPSGGWQPRPDKLSLRFLYAVAKVFRKWPTSYVWNARISFDEDNRLLMDSQWKRL